MTEHGATDGHVERYVSWLREDATLVAKRIRAAIRVETPLYAAFADDDAEAAWEAGVDAGLAMFLDGVAAGSGLTPARRALMERIGQDRADQGFPLDAIVASISVAARVAHDWVVARLGDTVSNEDRHALCELSARLTTFANEITAPALHAYLARREAQATTAEQARAWLFHDLLDGRIGSEDAVRARGAALGCDLAVPWAVVLVPPGPDADALVDDALAALPRAVAVPRSTASFPHDALVVPAGGPKEWAGVRRRLAAAAAAHKTVLLVVGPCQGPDDLHRRYGWAQSLVPHLDGLADGPGLLDAAGLREVALLATVPVELRRVFVDDILGPVERAAPTKAAGYLETLDSFLRHNKSADATASALGRDVKTVRNHMRRVERITGLCLDRTLHLHWFATALTLRRLVGPDRFPHSKSVQRDQ